MAIFKILMCGCAAGVLASAASAQAVSGAPSRAAPASATPADGQAVGDIIVTAQRRAERLQDVPLAVTAQTSADLVRAGITNIRDLTQVTPGLSFTTNGAFAQPTIRGVSSTLSGPGAESPTAIYVDGVYQPNQPGNVFDLPDVDRVEVLKGPQGTLFGRNATAGAISIHTRDPGNATTGDFSLDDGVYVGNGAHTSNAFTFKGFFATPLVADRLSASIAGYYQKTDGYLTDLRTGKGTGEIENYMVRPKLKWTPVDGVSFLLTGLYSHRDDNAGTSIIPLRGNSSAAFYPDAIVPTQPWHVASELKNGVNPVVAEQKAVSLRSEFDISHYGTLTVLSAYSKVNEVQTSDIDGAYSPSCLQAFGCLLYNLRYPTSTFQQEVTFASQKFGAFRFVAGAFYYHDVAKSISNINPPLSADGTIADNAIGPVYTSATVKTTAAAGFGEVNWDITDRLRVIGGVRYSWEKREGRGQVGVNGVPIEFPSTGAPKFKKATPRASVLFKATDHLNLYVTYSVGFKSGVLDSSGLSNNIARPETLKSVEGGLKYADRHFNLNLSGFHYHYTDLQVQFFNGSLVILSNARAAEIYGLDADATVRLPHGFEVRAAGSWVPKADYRSFPGATDFALPNTPFGMPQVVLDASGKRMLRAPKFTGNLTLGYSTHLANGGTLDANANVYMSSGYNWDLLGRVRTHAYATVNGNIGYTLPDSRLRLGIYTRNLTNKKYISGTVLAAFADGVVYAPPRQIGVNARYAF